MQGRGLAAAWGLLALVVLSTVAWLAFTDAPGREAGAPEVTVDIPAFPEPAEPSEPTGAIDTQPPPERTASASTESEPAPEQPLPVTIPPAPEPASETAEDAATEPETADDDAMAADGPQFPNAETTSDEAQAIAVEPSPALPDALVATRIPEIPPAPAPDVAEPPASERDDAREIASAGSSPPSPVMPIPAAPKTRPSPAGQPSAEEGQPATAETAEPPPERDDAAGKSGGDARDALPQTIEVGALRPIPDAVLQPLRPPEGPRADPALTENSSFGPLPVIAPDGRRPWQAYARPSATSSAEGLIAVVIGNLGLAKATTERAITDLPPEVTLSFAPYAEGINRWIAKARAAGHEVMLDLPMEPMDYPKNDPGPKALFTHLAQQENIERLHWVLGRSVGYVGVTNFMGSRFTTSPEVLRPVLAELRDRGLMFLDSRAAARSLATNMASEIGLPRAVNDRFIDVNASRTAIDRRLRELEQIAAREGAAVGLGYPYPVTIDRVTRWAEKLREKGNFALVPISAVVDRQADR